MVKIKVRFPESGKKQRNIADEVRHTVCECAEKLCEAMPVVMDVRTAGVTSVHFCPSPFAQTRGRGRNSSRDFCNSGHSY